MAAVLSGSPLIAQAESHLLAKVADCSFQESFELDVRPAEASPWPTSIVDSVMSQPLPKAENEDFFIVAESLSELSSRVRALESQLERLSWDLQSEKRRLDEQAVMIRGLNREGRRLYREAWQADRFRYNRKVAKYNALLQQQRELQAEYQSRVVSDSEGESQPSNGQASDPNCFITTACIRARGLPDDCPELQILRQFRDSYMLSTEAGREMVRHYLELAPKIVAALDGHFSQNAIWQSLYDDLVTPCSLLVISGAFSEAELLYSDYVFVLEDLFLGSRQPDSKVYDFCEMRPGGIS